MHWNLDWRAILSVVVAVATAVLRYSIVTPKDHDIAAHIRTLADDFAAVVHASAPEAPLADKVAAVADRLEPAMPNVNRSVLESAATGSLARLGVSKATP